MMNATARRGTVVVLLMLSAACGSPGPTAHTETGQPYARPRPTPPPVIFPPLSGQSRTFSFALELNYAVSDYTKNSRVVLYDNGAFLLEYYGLAAQYHGAYNVANGVVTFDFWGGTRDAPGSIRGDSLTVRFTEFMQHSDFEDAIYALMR